VNPLSSLNSILEIANLASPVSNTGAFARTVSNFTARQKWTKTLELIQDSHFGRHEDGKNASKRGIV
jgi:hypothetical protein